MLRHALALTCAFCLLDSGILPAQRTEGPRRVAATVVLLERLPQPDAPFVILRRADVSPRDVILLHGDATVEQFSEAVQLLLVARQVGGDSSRVAQTLRVRPQQRERTPRTLPWAARILATLRTVEPRSIPGIGTVPAVEIWLPPQNVRGRIRRGTDHVS